MKDKLNAIRRMYPDTTSHIHRRNRSFLARCVQLQNAHPAMAAAEVVDSVINAPAPEYYIDYERARRQVGRILLRKRKAVGEYRPECNRRILEIADCVMQCLQRVPYLTIGQALTRVLTQGQPSGYFISQRQGLNLYLQLLAQ